jgi:ubiquinone/menaquinone biosynthesis C-methylase UbiE
LDEARRVLGPGGRLIAVDFENPLNAKSKLGTLIVRTVERLAGREHYGDGKEFVKRGGLRGFLRERCFVEVSRREIAAGSLSVVVALPDR